jgi:hypothetical protein
MVVLVFGDFNEDGLEIFDLLRVNIRRQLLSQYARTSLFKLAQKLLLM